MAFTENQAKTRAAQIFEQVGLLIHLACKGSGVKESFVAGFVSVESAFSGGKVMLDSKRFEKGVYEDLISLRDKGFCYVGGKKRSTYSGVKQSQIKDATNAAIRNLATSWGITQIMGWWTFALKCTVSELRDPEKHLFYTIKLLKIVGGTFLTNGDLPSVLHIWNTGSASGKTYHEDYVENALKVKKHYDELLKNNPNKFSLSTAAPVAAESEAADPKNGALQQAVETPNDAPRVNSALNSEPQKEWTEGARPQVAENITNVNSDTGSEAIKAAQASPDTHVELHTETGFLKKIGAVLTAIVTGQYVIPQFIQGSFTGETVLKILESALHGLFVMRYFIFGSLALWFVAKKIEAFLIKREAILANTDQTKGNVVVTNTVKKGVYTRFYEWLYGVKN